jgi:8-oxo-dGTP pyrophosphatase MutT (NUDIX family)
MRVLHKAYVYLTCGRKLLVFSQPDQPDVGLQVPGGTLDPGESHLIGARREFHEETGLVLDGALDHLADQDHLFDNGRGRDLHRRQHFHARVARIGRDEWEHFEMTPNDGGDPIRFRLFWLDLDGEIDPAAFYEGFDAQLPLLRQRVTGG